MKVFISQPMNGKTDEQIKQERSIIEEKLIMLGYEPLNTIFDLDKNISPIFYLGKSIEVMAGADLVLFMGNWRKYRGCRIEYKVAREYGKRILILEENK